MSTHRALMMSGSSEIVMLPYIITNGDYILLKHSSESKNWGIIVKDKGSTSETFWLGARFRGIGNYNGKFACDSSSISSVSIDDKYNKLEITNNKLYVNDNIAIASIAGAFPENYIYLGRIVNEDGKLINGASGYVKRVWLKDGNLELILDAYPCFDKTKGKYGLYDYVSNKVFYFELGKASYDGDMSICAKLSLEDLKKSSNNNVVFVNYIDTQKGYFTTPYYGNGDERCEICAKFNDTSVSDGLFNALAGARGWRIGMKKTDGKYYVATFTNTVCEDKNEYNPFIFNKYDCNIETGDNKYKHRITNDGGFMYVINTSRSQYEYNIVIGGANEASSKVGYLSKWRINYVKFYDTSNKLLFEAYPVYNKTNNIYGLYNVKKHKIYYSTNKLDTYNWLE